MLLVPPNEKGMEIIKEKNLKYVFLFEEIFKEIEENNLDLENEVLRTIKNDIKDEICNLKAPKHGKTKIDPFKKRKEISLNK